MPPNVVKMSGTRYEYFHSDSKHEFAMECYLKGFAMTRMTREFSLLLLGSGMLSGGYFMLPEEDFEQRAEEQAQKRVGGPVRTGGAHLFYVGHFGSGGVGGAARSPAMAGVARGGLGAIGGRVGGGMG